MRQRANPVDVTLYLVTDRLQYEEDEFLRRIEDACKGGVTLVQLREKEAKGKAYLDLARKVKAVTDRYGLLLIIDDRVDVALASGAAGVHVGQSDLPVAEARKLMGPDKIIGATAKTVEQALRAQEEGADYLGTGAIYPTSTRVDTVITPIERLNDICRAVDIPVAAIGGLDAENMGVLSSSPVSGIAVVSAIMKAPDAGQAARELKDKFWRMMRENVRGD